MAVLLSMLLGLSGMAVAQDALRPGEAFVTRFSGTTVEDGQRVLDASGTVASLVDLRGPGQSPQGQHWIDEPQRSEITAEQVGQVFSVAVGPDGAEVYLAASSAFGLHRRADASGWMDGMWGRDGGPGTIYRLRAENGFEPERFADITLDGRANTGAALGGIAIDRQHGQLFVSDLESGMIHRLGLRDGGELGRFDYGGIGRVQFHDVAAGVSASLPAVEFDPASAPRLSDCPDGDFESTPSCWNIADFRRRTYGLAVRHDPASGSSRLFYATWGGAALGHPDWTGAASDDRRNAVWSIGLDEGGAFIQTDVRREFVLPDFPRGEDGASVEETGPVADLSFSACGDQGSLLVSERGALRNAGLSARDAFARPHEARVLRYDADAEGGWQLSGRYDVGFYDRSEHAQPYIRANAAGGASFGPGFDPDWQADGEVRNGFVWMSGDNLCTPLAPCVDPATGTMDDTNQVHGLQGTPAELLADVLPDAATAPYPATGSATAPNVPAGSFMVDLDRNVDEAGAPVADEAGARDATMIGSVAVHQPCPAEEVQAIADAAAAQEEDEELPPPFDIAELPEGEAWPEDYYPEDSFPEDFFPEDVFPDGAVADDGGWPDGGGWPDDGVWPDDGEWPDGGIIPDDFDELAETFDFAIQKAGPEECQEGVACAYTVEIRNLGTDLFFGHLAFTDQLPDDAAFVDGPAGWNCTAVEPEVSCRTDLPVELAGAGGSITLDLTATMPFGVAGEEVQNCVSFDWTETGFADREGDDNDEACVLTPITERFDLGITKSAPDDCNAARPCTFEIEVTNHGPGDFTGPIVLEDTLPDGAGIVGASGIWSCLDGEDTSATCTSSAVTLGEGDSHSLELTWYLGREIGDEIENCVAIAWDAMSADDGEGDANPDDVCVTVPLVTEGFDLQVRKAGPTSCTPGEECTFSIDWVSRGPEPYTGTYVGDDRPSGLTEADFVDDGGHCELVFGTITCDVAHGELAPGVYFSNPITFDVPADLEGEDIRNCFDLDWVAIGTPGDLNAANDSACLQIPVGEGADLAVTKTGDTECALGGLCTYTISIEIGDAPHFGALSIYEQLPPGSTLVDVSAGWTCRAYTPETYRCNTNEPAELTVGETATLELTVQMPEAIVGDIVENCAQIRWGPDMGFNSDGDSTNDGPVCVDTTIVEDIGLDGETPCDRGTACPVGVRVINFGGRRFTGMFAVDGAFDAPVEILDIIPPNDGWSCRVVGQSRYRCGRTRPLQLQKDDEQKLRIVLDIPADFDRDTIEHYFWIVRPQGEKPDAKPGNDSNMSIITIRGPRPELRPEPERPELGITKVAPTTCAPGGDCTYTVTVTNNGPGKYTGILLVDDYPPGSTNASLVSVSAGWSCVETGPTITCRFAPAELDPGESVSFSLTVRLPEDMGAYGETMVDGRLQNCAWIVRPYGTVPLGMDDEMALRYAVEQDLATEGFLDPAEVDGRFNATTTAALEAYQRARRLTVTGDADTETLEFMFPASTQLDGDENGRNDKACAASDILRTVEPTPELRPVATLPECGPAESLYRRLQDVPEGWQRRRIPHEGRTYFCARPRQQIAAPDLAVVKTARTTECRAGSTCEFDVRVINNGTRPYVGPLRIVDAVPPGASLASSAPDAWSCRSARGEVSCATHSGSLAPGATADLRLALRLPRRASGNANNCAALDWNSTTVAMTVQNALNQLGFAAGTVDGKVGPRTRQAIRDFQAAAGRSPTGRIDAALLGALFGSWGNGDANAGNDRDCAGIVVTAPTQPGPECERGWEQVSQRRARGLPRQRWEVQQFSAAGQTIYCARRREQPEAAPPQCERGWDQVSRRRASGLPRQRWEVQQLSGAGQTIYCVRRREQPEAAPPQCERGWDQVSRRRASGLPRQRWEVQQLSGAGQTIYCVRRREQPEATPPQCERGWDQVSRRRAGGLPRQRWEVQQLSGAGQTIYCVRRREQQQVSCPRGFKPVDRRQAKTLVQKGWQIQQVGDLLCARPRTGGSAVTPQQLTPQRVLPRLQQLLPRNPQ